MNTSSLTLFLFFSVFSLPAQELQYDILLLGKKIGSVYVKRTPQPDGSVSYRVQSNSFAKVLFTERQSEMVQESVYAQGKLISSFTQNKVDGVVEEVAVTKTKTHYLVQLKKTKEQILVNENILHSAVWMYFHEPVNVRKVFSERLGQFYPLMKTGENQYSYTVRDGATNIVTYKDGYPEEIEIKKTLGSVWMRRVRNP